MTGLLMIKGVNKNIIEVINTEDEFFERAILFIRPGHAGNKAAAGHAQQYLCGLKARAGVFSRIKIKNTLTVVASALAGAAICFCVMRLLLWL